MLPTSYAQKLLQSVQAPKCLSTTAQLGQFGVACYAVNPDCAPDFVVAIGKGGGNACGREWRAWSDVDAAEEGKNGIRWLSRG